MIERLRGEGSENGLSLEDWPLGGATSALNPWKVSGEDKEVPVKVEQAIAGKGYEKGVERIYMIGDNPRSDILGANIFQSGRGIEWISILVKSGLYKGGNHHGAPRAIVDDVSAAVDWAFENERRIENNEPLEKGPYHIAAAKRLEAPGKRQNHLGAELDEGPKEPKGSRKSKVG